MNVEGSYLHHVGHVVRDIVAATSVYQRMGFLVPPPEFPALTSGDGAPPRAVGAGNAHVRFRRNFVELVTVAAPARGARLVPLQVPTGAQERVLASIAATTRRLATALRRREGVHILVLQTPDAERAAVRLREAGVECGPVQRLHRPADPDGAGGTAITLVEVDDVPGRSPEGRVAVAEELLRTDPVAALDHPNGARALRGAVLCAPDTELDDVALRYGRYLGHPARPDGPTRRFDVDGVHLTLVAASALATVLPGESPPDRPAFVGYEVEVHDSRAARRLIEHNGLPVRRTSDGAPFVPAAAARGTAVVLRDPTGGAAARPGSAHWP